MKDKEIIIIKRIFFILSIIPYIIFLLCGIAVCINYGRLDIELIFTPMIEFSAKAIIIDKNIIYITLALFSVVYPIYYFLDKSNKKVEKSNKKFKISRIILYLTFIPYLFLIYFAIFGYEYSTAFMGPIEKHYGIEAIATILITYSILPPIYPLVILYQIIYYLVNRKNMNSKKIKSI